MTHLAWAGAHPLLIQSALLGLSAFLAPLRNLEALLFVELLRAFAVQEDSTALTTPQLHVRHVASSSAPKSMRAIE